MPKRNAGAGDAIGSRAIPVEDGYMIPNRRIIANLAAIAGIGKRLRFGVWRRYARRRNLLDHQQIMGVAQDAVAGHVYDHISW